ncbi:MAG: hypothetical protein K6D02_02595 [Lachnospiraceae bacterium]|nr:hypothetical protein [Lachnospiraceae bacterium]
MRKELKKILKKSISFVLVAAMLATSANWPVKSAKAEDTATETEKEFVVERISNKDGKEGDVDGLVPGGDRLNSYSWCMTSRGDKLYIGTLRGLAGTMAAQVIQNLMAAGVEKSKAIALFNTISDGAFPIDLPDKGGDIICYNMKTDEIKVLYTADLGVTFRMAVNYNGNVYMGSYSSNSNKIYQIDENDNLEVVYETAKGTSMRAACEHEGNLYFGGVDSTEELPEGYENGVKLAVIKMDKDNPSKWDRVADVSDFNKVYACSEAVKNPTASPIWDIVSFNGYIYATLPYGPGFVVYRGHKAEGDEKANSYGWYWEEIVGKFNGVNYPGLSSEPDGYTGEYLGTSSLVATPFVFKDKLYLMDFDNTISAIVDAVSGLSTGSAVSGKNILSTMYKTLKHPQSLWVFDEETGKFNKVENFCKLMDGTTNEYLWRTAIYDGELYITTMDSSVLYYSLTRFTDFSGGVEQIDEKKDQVEKIANLVKLLDLDESDNEKVQKIAKLIIQLDNLLHNAGDNISSEKAQEIAEKYAETVDALREALSKFVEYFEKIFAKYAAWDVVEGDADTNDALKLAAALKGEADVDDALDDEGIDDITDGDEAEAATAGAIDYSKYIDIIKQVMENLTTYVKETIEAVVNLVKSIDWDVVYQYGYISKMVNSATPGFDMYKTSDGENFTLITDDGFGDRFNYGGRTLEATENGLFIGTANPFYGTQLYKLTNKSDDTPETVVPTSDAVVPTSDAVVPTSDAVSKVSLSVNKTKVVVAPNKTTNIGFTAKNIAASDIKVTSSNKKLVTASVKNGKIQIKVTKKAKSKRGTIVKVTVKAGDITKTINVAVKNAAKKIKAKKKTVTVKKGKTAKIVFKVTKANNKKKAVTDTYTAKASAIAKIKKIATVKKVTAKKGKVIVKIKAKKKGTKKLTLKLSKKVKANVKVVVK